MTHSLQAADIPSHEQKQPPLTHQTWLKHLDIGDGDMRPIFIKRIPDKGRVWIGHPGTAPETAELVSAYRPVYRRPLDKIRIAIENMTPALNKAMRDLDRIAAKYVNERHQDPRGVRYNDFLKGPYA
jgi:hypothetical protein